VIFSKHKAGNLEQDKDALLNNYSSSSRFAESYRTLRTNLFFSAMENDLKSVVITSSVAGEGKTTTCVNLAHTVAQADRSVLLVDMDLRRPHLSSLFSMRKEKGVSDLVADVFGIHLTQGALDQYPVNDLIQLTTLQARTCCLELENEETQVSISFDKGRMIDIYWKNRPEAMKLANTLIQEKLLTEKESLLALGHQKKSVQRLGTILYTMGFVSKKDIAKTLSVHTIEAIKAVSAMEEGKFTFSSLSAVEVKKIISHGIDFHKLYEEFNVGEDMGDFLKKTIDDMIQPTYTENLFILPAGRVPPNPAELVGSKRTGFLMDYLKTRYDFIVIDTSPVMPATDALLVAPHTDGTILVIKSRHANRKIIQEVLNRFESNNQPIIGTILNRVDMKKEGYYKYYRRYYASYYGK
jgi:capsular exopolysaccharide synthesis family protein